MKNNEKHIADIAMQEFAKYGFRKTTMQDVADAAGVSRQTLYNYVATKDELLKLVARHYFADAIHQCETELAQAKNLSDAFDSLINNFVCAPWHMIKSIPEAEEFEATSNDIIGDEIQKANSQKAALVEKTIIEHLEKTKRALCKPDEIAAFFCATAAGIKSNAQSEDELNMLCAVFKQSLMRLQEQKIAA